MQGERLQSYPLKFHPVYKEYIWGGRNLERLGRQLPPDTMVAESWELSGHPDGISLIANGEYAGMTFPDYLRYFGSQAMGEALPKEYATDFPLLVKLIDANRKLSVQVHPDDSYAGEHEIGQRGKNEMWYIISADPGAEIIYNLKPGTDRTVFARAVVEEKVEEFLQTVAVKASDVFNIPAGTVHGIGAGIILAEVQQSSNLTYRIHDYNRRDANGNTRSLHIEKAMDVINFSAANHKLGQQDGMEQGILVANQYFRVELKKINGQISEKASGDRFSILLCLSGQGTIRHHEGETLIGQAETVFIPASMGDHLIEGTLELLKIQVP